MAMKRLSQHGMMWLNLEHRHFKNNYLEVVFQLSLVNNKGTELLLHDRNHYSGS